MAKNIYSLDQPNKVLTDNHLQYLLSRTPKAMPDDPTYKGWTAKQIKEYQWKGFEILFNYLKSIEDSYIKDIGSVDEFVNKLRVDINNESLKNVNQQALIDKNIEDIKDLYSIQKYTFLQLNIEVIGNDCKIDDETYKKIKDFANKDGVKNLQIAFSVRDAENEKVKFAIICYDMKQIPTDDNNDFAFMGQGFLPIFTSYSINVTFTVSNQNNKPSGLFAFNANATYDVLMNDEAIKQFGEPSREGAMYLKDSSNVPSNTGSKNQTLLEIGENNQINQINLKTVTDNIKTSQEIGGNKVDSTLTDVLKNLYSISTGLASSYVFDTYASMVSTLKLADKGTYKIGDQLLIKDANVPDYWISGINEDNTSKTGYYQILESESQVEASNLKYHNDQSKVEASNVKEALDDLYNRDTDITSSIRTATDDDIYNLF